MKKTRIGILTTVKPLDLYYKKNIVGLEGGYFDFFGQYGKVLAITPESSPDDYAPLDLLVLPGGADLSLALQNKRKEDNHSYSAWQGGDNPAFTTFYHKSMSAWVKSGTPIFGICLGFQAINNYFGGYLTANGKGHSLLYPDTHGIAVFSPKLGYDNVIYTEVNSRHHQFIRLDNQVNDLSKELLPIAFGSKLKLDTEHKARTLVGYARKNKMPQLKVLDAVFTDNLDQIPVECCNVEAYIHNELPIAGVQWHPEDMWIDNYTRGDKVSDRIIKYLLDKGNTRVSVLTDDNPVDSNAKVLETM